MSGTGSRTRLVTRTARPDDLPAVLALIRQHRADAHAEEVLTGQTPGAAAAAGFRRLLTDPDHRVVLAVVPGPNAAAGGAHGEVAVGLAILGIDPLATEAQRTSDEYGVWLNQILALEGLSFGRLDAAIIATVVPAVLFDLRGANDGLRIFSWFGAAVLSLVGSWAFFKFDPNPKKDSGEIEKSQTN